MWLLLVRPCLAVLCVCCVVLGDVCVAAVESSLIMNVKQWGCLQGELLKGSRFYTHAHTHISVSFLLPLARSPAGHPALSPRGSCPHQARCWKGNKAAVSSHTSADFASPDGVKTNCGEVNYQTLITVDETWSSATLLWQPSGWEQVSVWDFTFIHFQIHNSGLFVFC